MERTLPNKCYNIRGEIGGRAYRMISFFAGHPSEIAEDQWTIFNHNDSKFIVDKLTLSVMAECECEFLTREIDRESAEPAIVSVYVKDLAKLPIKEQSKK
jgi:hypothetical protein